MTVIVKVRCKKLQSLPGAVEAVVATGPVIGGLDMEVSGLTRDGSRSWLAPALFAGLDCMPFILISGSGLSRHRRS